MTTESRERFEPTGDFTPDEFAKLVEHNVLNRLAEILRTAANRRLHVQSHDTGAFTMHAIANEIVIALTLPDASRKYTGASGNDE